jgi:pyruvate/2-oxoglutarate dehydrogenase complex dihydrolipoamide dehydrogenase (E3) component
MGDMIDTDICVIGAGSGGLNVAYGASQAGARMVLVERHHMGGDCLNTGCVPSKALLAAAHAAASIGRAARFGVRAGPATIDFAAVHRHVHDIIAAIEPHDSAARYEGLGVTVVHGQARFLDPRTLAAGTTTIRARRYVIATGSRAAIPPLPGLADAPYLTNETLFDLTVAPRHLVILGGGPVGCEMAQAHRRLGVPVTILERLTLLPREDPALVAVLRDRLVAEGVIVHEGAEAKTVERTADGIAVIVAIAGAEQRIEGSHLLVATGRVPVVDGLDLAAAGIEHDAKGIVTDDGMRTTNRRVFAIGDVAGGPLFTHAASYHAAIVLKRALFRLPARRGAAIPWVTYTDPELAHVGLTEAAARAAGHAVRVATHGFDHVDRAIAERHTEGFAKIVAAPNGRILGASIVGPRAGDLLQPWVLAMHARLRMGAMAQAIAPYPTLVEVGKRAAGAWFAPRVFGPGSKRLVRLLGRLG